jgi:hypothetical protein
VQFHARNYDAELNKLNLMITNEKEFLLNKIEKCFYQLEENNKFVNISLNNQDKEFSKKLTMMQEECQEMINQLKTDLENHQQTNQLGLNTLSMKYQSDLSNSKDSIISILKEKVIADIAQVNQRIDEAHQNNQSAFHQIAQNIDTFAMTLEHLGDENKELNGLIQKNKDLVQLEIYSFKEKYLKEVDAIYKALKDGLNEVKYEENHLMNRLQIVENHLQQGGGGVGGGGNVSAMGMSQLSQHSNELQQQNSLLFPPIPPSYEDDMNNDHSQQNSFLFDPNQLDENHPFYLSTGQQPQQSQAGRGPNNNSAAGPAAVTQEQLIKLSSLLEMSISRLSNVENEFYNLQIEVNSVKSQQNQMQILQDQALNNGKMQQEFIELTKKMALQNNNNNSTTSVNAESLVSKEIFQKVQDELRSELKQCLAQVKELLSTQEMTFQQENHEASMLLEKKQKNFEQNFTNTIQQAQSQQFLSLANALKEDLLNDSANLLEKLKDLEKNQQAIQVHSSLIVLDLIVY